MNELTFYPYHHFSLVVEIASEDGISDFIFVIKKAWFRQTGLMLETMNIPRSSYTL